MAGMIVVICLAWGILVGYIADQKGRDLLGWLVAGFLFGLFALIAVCAVPKKEK